MTNKKRVVTLIAVVLIISSLAAVCTAWNHGGREAKLLRKGRMWALVSSDLTVYRYQLIPDENGRIALYTWCQIGRAGEKLEGCLGEKVELDDPFLVDYYCFGKREDMQYIITGSEDGYSLFEFSHYIYNAEEYMHPTQSAEDYAGFDFSSVTLGYVFSSVYGVDSAEDIKRIVVSPHENVPFYALRKRLEIGRLRLSGEEKNEVYVALAGAICDYMDYAEEYSGYARCEKEPIFNLDFEPIGDDSREKTLGDFGKRNITVYFENGSKMDFTYNGNYGAFESNTDIDASFLFPTEAAKALNELFGIK